MEQINSRICYDMIDDGYASCTGSDELPVYYKHKD